MKYKIYPLKCCDGSMIMSKMFYQGAPANQAVPMAYGCFLLESEDGEHYLVDSGYPFPKDIIAGDYADVYPIRQNAVPDAETLLAPYGVKPEEITKIFLTHLHYDHAWNLGYYPNAVIYCQKSEMQAAITPLMMQNERERAYSFHPKVYEHSWIKYRLRFELFDGEGEVFPGISVIYTRGHSLGSQTVIVDTNDGQYAIVGDYAPNLDSIYKGLPTGVNIDVALWCHDYPKVKKLLDNGCKFLANHDLRSYEKRVYG